MSEALDAVSAELSGAEAERDSALRECVRLRRQAEQLIAERDEAVGAVARLEARCEKAFEWIDWVVAERDRARAEAVEVIDLFAATAMVTEQQPD